MCAPFVGRFNFLVDFVIVALSRQSSPWAVLRSLLRTAGWRICQRWCPELRKDPGKSEDKVLRSKTTAFFWSKLRETCKILYFRQFSWVSIKKSSYFLIENVIARLGILVDEHYQRSTIAGMYDFRRLLIKCFASSLDRLAPHLTVAHQSEKLSLIISLLPCTNVTRLNLPTYFFTWSQYMPVFADCNLNRMIWHSLVSPTQK